MKITLLALLWIGVGCAQYLPTPNPGEPYKLGSAAGGPNVFATAAGPATSLAINISSLGLQNTNSLVVQCWSGTGTGPYTPVTITSLTAVSTSSVTANFSSTSNLVCVANSSGGVGPAGATGPTGATGAAGTNGTNGAISRIYNSGSALPVEPFVNFVNGGCVDNSGATRTDCTLTAGGGSAPYIGTVTVSGGGSSTISAATHGVGAHPQAFIYDSTGAEVLVAQTCSGGTYGCADASSTGNITIGPFTTGATYGVIISGLGGGSGGGSGTVTHTAGALTSTQCVSGNGGADIQTPSVNCTIDSSGNMVANSFSAGAGSGSAGFIQLGQGTAPSLGTTAITLHAPSSVTSYRVVFPGVAANGIPRWGNSANVVTMAVSELSGDCTTSGSNAVTCTKTSGTVFGPLATSTATAAVTKLTSGTPSAAAAADIYGLFTGTHDSTHCTAGDGTMQSCAGGASGVSSFTGDGALISNSGSTAGVTVTLANAAAHKYWGNPTGSSAAPGYNSLVAADLPAIPLSGLATQSADTVTMNASGGSAAPAAVAMPTCTTGADLYNTTTHTWSCVSITGGGATFPISFSPAVITASSTLLVQMFYPVVVSSGNGDRIRVYSPISGTLQKMYLWASSASPTQSGTGSLVCTIIKNGATNGPTITIAAGATVSTVQTDLSTTLAVSAGDYFWLQCANNASVNSLNVASVTAIIQ